VHLPQDKTPNNVADELQNPFRNRVASQVHFPKIKFDAFFCARRLLGLQLRARLVQKLSDDYESLAGGAFHASNSRMNLHSLSLKNHL
jgi:hypothetical protein